jgi:hypothetical protein
MAPRKPKAVVSNTAPAEMVFDGSDIRPIPAGSTHVIFKILDAGANQSASLGVVLHEQTVPNGSWEVIRKEIIDNLPDTPEVSSMVFFVKPGARYAIVFQGEMHSLWKDKAPLTLELSVSADGVGAPLEDFGGAKSVAGSFCSIRGRARLKAN